jgi:transposase
LPAAERREAERSEADRSAAGKTAAPEPPTPPRPNLEVVADAKRRAFTAEYKQRILAEADAAAAQPGAIGALLRREGLYSSHRVTSRCERQAGILKGLTPHKRGPKSKRNPQEEALQQLHRENQRLTQELRKAGILIKVHKTVGALLGWRLPKPDPEEKPRWMLSPLWPQQWAPSPLIPSGWPALLSIGSAPSWARRRRRRRCRPRGQSGRFPPAPSVQSSGSTC